MCQWGLPTPPLSWGAGVSYQPPDRLEISHSSTGHEDVSLGAFLILHCLASLSMINREALVTCVASRDKQ